MDAIWVSISIVVAAYLISDGLKNFSNPNTKNFLELLDDDDEHELIKESEVHYFIGITKEDAKLLIQQFPDIPHIRLNDNVYYPKAKLRKWLMNLGND